VHWHSATFLAGNLIIELNEDAERLYRTHSRLHLDHLAQIFDLNNVDLVTGPVCGASSCWEVSRKIQRESRNDCDPIRILRLLPTDMKSLSVIVDHLSHNDRDAIGDVGIGPRKSLSCVGLAITIGIRRRSPESRLLARRVLIRLRKMVPKPLPVVFFIRDRRLDLHRTDIEHPVHNPR